MSILKRCLRQFFNWEMGESVILFEIKGLYKCYDNKAKSKVYAINNINLTIKKGEILGLVGESGCGKSTLGKVQLKLEQTSRCRIIFNQQDKT